MGNWKRVSRCKECGKIYDNGVPYICQKCGATIAVDTPVLLQALGHGEVTLTDKAEKVVAKHTLSGWKIRHEEQEETEEQGVQE